MKIILFGSNGMLGRYLYKYLSQKYEVIQLTREDFDLSKIDYNTLIPFLERTVTENDLIINASGLIKQRDCDLIDMINVNSVFPNFLGEIKKTLKCNVIHITTDCVYSGNRGMYDENDLHDCTDEYGKTKSLGENKDLTVIRTSIIGEELRNKKSLLEWVISQKNTTVKGYSNHYWNGITCLELAKVIERMIMNNNFWTGVKHVHSIDTKNKFELVNIINEVYDLNLTIEEHTTPTDCYRNLTTINNKMVYKTIEEQIIETKNFNIR
jgi:dTDP-4-dehydrorhamnose reductase